jgi:hypothetical protein
MDIEKKRRRVALVAAINGWQVGIVGVLCLLCSFLFFSVEGILIGLAFAASAFMELSGRRCLKQNRPEARRWLVRSQLFLMAVIILYAGYHILLFDPQALISQINQAITELPPASRTQLSMVVDMKTVERYVVLGLRILYPALIAVTVLYQGGLWLYYTRATRKLDRTAAGLQGEMVKR